MSYSDVNFFLLLLPLIIFWKFKKACKGPTQLAWEQAAVAALIAAWAPADTRQ